MSEHDTPQGPTDPHGPGGADAPAPPGGPQRTDTPADDSDRPDEREQGDAARALQEENAETSLDEPSDGSGGE